MSLSFVSIHEASIFLNKSHKTLQRWDDNGTFPAMKDSYGRRFYSQEALTNMKNLLNGVTRSEAAKQIGVTEKTMWLWDKTGVFRSSYTIGSTSYYLQQDIDNYLAMKKEVTV